MKKKLLMETIANCQEQMEAIVAKAESEERVLTEDEVNQFGEFEAQAKNAQATIDAMDAVANMSAPAVVVNNETPEQKDVKDFANMVRNSIKGVEVYQADSNITKGDNGAVIPSTIASKIIEKVNDISPIFARAQKYNVKGTLHIPYIADGDDGIAMAYADEFTDLEAKSVKFSSIDLTGYLAGVLAKVSNSLINNSDINITNEVIRLMAEAIALFYEKETLVGTSGKSTGISNATQIVTSAAATAITADELIQTQDMLKSAFQQNACWIMNPATLTAIRQLKYSGSGEYILNPDVRAGFGMTLLGKPVFTSDQAPKLAAGAKGIVYGDFANALAVKMVEQFELQVLREKYATQHVTGLVGWTEFDSKIQNQQAIAVLQQKAS